MQVRKLSSTDAFLVVDLEGAERTVGVARLAPKVLVDGAELLARSVTYTLAAFGVQASGASAGINAKGDDRAAAVAAFCEELAPEAGAGALHLSPGVGLDDTDLAPLGVEPLDAGLGARGAVAATAAFTGGGTAAVVGAGWLDRVGPWWTDVGASTIDEGGLDADVEVLFVAGKAGVVDHESAGSIRARTVVALTPVPVTARAYAELSRAGVVYVPDLLGCAAPLLAAVDPDGGDPVARVATLAAEVAPAGVDAWRRLVERAEAFLAGWQPAVPFGRPLA